MSTFNAIDYINKANEREHAARDGKAVETKPVEAKPAAAAVEPKPKEAPVDASEDTREEHEADAAGHRVSRSTRRLLRQLGEAEGRAKVLEELVKSGHAPAGEKKPAAAAEEDPEPQAENYKDYALFQADLAKWQARKETTKALDEREQREAFREQMRAMDAKALEDMKLIPDYEQVAKEAMEDGPEFVPDEHPNLMGLLATSDVKAFVLYHLAKHPDEMERMLVLSKTPGDQIRQFARLEGRVEKLYGDKPEGEKKPAEGEKKPVEEKKPAETAAERDAKKARPSEAVAARGGSAPPTAVSPVLADGRTLNPAWKAQANDREGRRR